jgi:hypothetical protein
MRIQALAFFPAELKDDEVLEQLRAAQLNALQPGEDE